MALPRLWLTTGEPAGVGPELVLDFARQPIDAELVVVGDPELLYARARALGLTLSLEPWQPGAAAKPAQGRLWVDPVPLAVPAQPGRLDARNAAYVLQTLKRAVTACGDGTAEALVTAPVHKGIIADAGAADPSLRINGRPFSGHTEYLAALCGGTPVMMLVAEHLRVALATTHLPLRAVADAITTPGLLGLLTVLDHDLRERFGLARPKIRVCGLNPHAGEGGHLGQEEITVIEPAIREARTRGLDVAGPFAADTLLTPARWSEADVVLAMYHDQGLPPLKYAGFGHGVNVTLGLPIIRTSVDHGTALDLAGSGRASPGSLRKAAELAATLVRNRRERAAA